MLAFVDASPGVLVVYLTAPDAAVAVWGGPDGARAEVAADPQGGHLDVREGQLVGWGEVEVHAAEAVVLAVLGVLREGLVVDELGEFALLELVGGGRLRRVRGGEGVGRDGTKRRDYRVITTTRPRESLGGGAGVEAGGYRTRTSALTGGGASTGVATSVMALGSRRGDVSPGEKPLTSRVPEHVVFCQNEICMFMMTHCEKNVRSKENCVVCSGGVLCARRKSVFSVS